MPSFNTSDIEKIISATQDEIYPELPKAVLEGFSPIHESKSNTLSWMSDQSINWKTVKASVVICSKNVKSSDEFAGILVPVDNPRLIFTKILRKFNPNVRRSKIETTAMIGENCVIGKNVYIGHFVVLEDNVVVGDNTEILHHAVIFHDVTIGKNVLIKPHAVIGARGFGFEDEGDIPLAIPHIGNVVIDNHAEVGSFTTVLRGTLGTTWIKEHAKVDDHVHIAHNVTVGKAAKIIACAEVSGSVKVGNGAWIGPNAAILDGIELGEKALIGMGAVIIKDCIPNGVYAGNPARLLRMSKTEE